MSPQGRLFLDATIKMNVNSAAKTAQIAQFAISAAIDQAPEETSCSTISTGIKADAAAKIKGPKGWVTRPS